MTDPATLDDDLATLHPSGERSLADLVLATLPAGAALAASGRAARLPAHPFAAHRLQRAVLGRVRLTRLALPPVLALRRARSLPSRAAIPVVRGAEPAATPLELAAPRQPAQWPWTLATLAFLAALVAACARAASW